jgi:hypothetical protein
MPLPHAKYKNVMNDCDNYKFFYGLGSWAYEISQSNKNKQEYFQLIGLRDVPYSEESFRQKETAAAPIT